MASFFDRVKAPSLKKYEYDFSNEVKLSGKVGELIPFNHQLLSPGDTFRGSTEVFLRTAPLIHPIFQKLNCDIHHFFVPLRLIWDEFETFITGYDQKTARPTELTVPKFVLKGVNFPLLSDINRLIENVADGGSFDPDVIPANGYKAPFAISSLSDYLGFPCCELARALGVLNGSVTEGTRTAFNVEFSQLPWRAYQQIFNDYYRDSIKEPIIDFDKSSLDYEFKGAWQTSDVVKHLMRLRKRALGKDYFTTAQPTPQLGEDVVLSSEGSTINSPYVTPIPPSDANIRVSASDGHLYWGSNTLAKIVGANDLVVGTINKLRELFGIQKWADTGNKFGSRYREQTLGHFGVETPDARLQRAQYLGGGRVNILINQVSQLSEGNADSPLGMQAGQAAGYGSDNFFDFEAKEHGIFMSIVSILPENTYYRGIPRQLLVSERFDFPFPEFANLGEQEVKSKEMNLFYQDSFTYGYQERYAEFKSPINRAHGEFTTNLRNFFMASPQSSNSCTSERELRVNPLDYDNVFALESSEADNVYFLFSNHITKFTPLPYLNRVTTDYV